MLALYANIDYQYSASIMWLTVRNVKTTIWVLYYSCYVCVYESTFIHHDGALPYMWSQWREQHFMMTK